MKERLFRFMAGIFFFLCALTAHFSGIFFSARDFIMRISGAVRELFKTDKRNFISI